MCVCYDSRVALVSHPWTMSCHTHAWVSSLSLTHKQVLTRGWLTAFCMFYKSQRLHCAGCTMSRDYVTWSHDAECHWVCCDSFVRHCRCYDSFMSVAWLVMTCTCTHTHTQSCAHVKYNGYKHQHKHTRNIGYKHQHAYKHQHKYTRNTLTLGIPTKMNTNNIHLVCYDSFYECGMTCWICNVNTSCHTHGWVMWHIHGWVMWHTHGWVMWHRTVIQGASKFLTKMSHVTLMNESRHTHGWVTWHRAR